MSDQSIVTIGNYMSYGPDGERVAAFATEEDRDTFEAAPDLLEACEVANRFFEQNDDFTDGEYPIPGFILDMRIAIKKARRTPNHTDQINFDDDTRTRSNRSMGDRVAAPRGRRSESWPGPRKIIERR